MTVAPFTTPPTARRPHTIDAERARFYELLWGDATGYVQVAAGLPAADILARGWPLADDERPADPAELGDKMLMLLWSRATGDAFKAAGRPHTGKVFAWPAEARALDRHVEKLAGEYDNVFVRKYVAATEAGAKHGDAPAVAQVVQVEDAPADLEGLAPAYSFTLQTSEYSRHGFYRLARPLPWATVKALAEAAALRLAPLGADSGGPNPAQYTRVPATRNTKAKAGRYRVRLVEGVGDVLPAELARAVGLDLARASDKTNLPEATARRDPGDLAGDAAAEPWRARSTRDALDALAAPWRPIVRQGRGGLLGDNGAPRGFKGRALENWSGDGTGDGSRDVYHVMTSLLLYGYTDGQALALAEHWAHEHRASYATKRGAAGVWLDVCRVLCKEAARLGDKRRIREAQPPADVAPIPGPELPRARRGRPVGHKADNAERLAGELARRIGELVTRSTLAGALGLSPRSVTTHLATLASAGRLDLLPGPRGFTVVRVEIKSCAAPIAAPAHQDAPEAAEGGKKSAAAEGGNYGPAEALQCGGASLGEHAPQIATPCPAPAAGDAPALDLAELVAEAVRTFRPGLVDPATGEKSRIRVDAALVRAYVAQRAPGLDTAAIETLLPAARATVNAERAKVRQQLEIDAMRAQVAALDDRALTNRVKAEARTLVRGERQHAPRRAWLRVRFTVAEEERRRRRGDRRAYALAQAAADRLISMARTLPRDDAGGRVTTADLWALVEANRPAPSATRRPRVELPRRAEQPPAELVALDSERAAAAFATSADTAVTPLDPGPPAEGAPLWLDAGKMAAARERLVALAARGDSLILAEVKGVKSGD